MGMCYQEAYEIIVILATMTLEFTYGNFFKTDKSQ